MPQRALLIINSSAGGSSRLSIDLLRRAALMLGVTLDVALPGTPEETSRLVQEAKQAGYTRLLCAGGDGTINAVVPALLDNDIPLGIIPTGTVNVLARELDIPLDPMAALQIALAGKERQLDIGVANGHSFTLMAGLGFDAKVVAEITPRFKEYFGPLTYVTTGLQELTRYKPSQFHLDADGVEFSLPAWLIIVGNARNYAYQLPIAPEARIDDGELDVCLFAEHTIWDRLTQIGAVFARQHVRHPNVRVFRARKLHINAEPPVHVQLDGDPAGFSPVDISVRPQALRVMVPREG